MGGTKKHIYGEVNGITDIQNINETIRGEIRGWATKPRITESVKRSMYLITLTYSPAWKDAFKGKIRRMREVAKEEYSRTARLANRRLKKLGIEGKYDEKWG